MARRQFSQAEKDSWKAESEKRVSDIGHAIVQQFEKGNVPQAISQQYLKGTAAPCRSWSFSNQMLTAIAGHNDARTSKAWFAVGRKVKKGEKAFYILAPNKFSFDKEDKETGETKRVSFLRGFKPQAEFGLSQTEIFDADKWAKANAKNEAEEQFLRNLPLREVAEAWGMNVISFNASNAMALGWYKLDGSEIALGVKNLSTWAHELIHAADDKLGNLTERGQHWRSEVVAELGGAIILMFLGYTKDADVGGAYKYIQKYAKEAGKDVEKACIEVLDRCGKAVNLILETAREVNEKNLSAVA